ncbi:MAG: GspE/PulE family protein [Spirochaetaceae bacterium]
MELSRAYSLHWGVVVLQRGSHQVLLGATEELPEEERLRLRAAFGAPVAVKRISREEFLAQHARMLSGPRKPESEGPAGAEELASPEAPAVVVVNGLLGEAAALGASDLHLRLMEGSLMTALRREGRLEEHLRFAEPLGTAVIRRLLSLADLDPYSGEAAQEGSFSFQGAAGTYDARLSLLRRRRENLSVALRLFPPSEKRLSLDEIALLPEAREELAFLASRDDGLILLCGPTGSGKSTTLHAMLRPEADRGRRVVTIEDPVEQEEERFLQLNLRKVTEGRVLLEAALRQDPDIIVLGEVRSPETTRYAIEAALTGHLVLTTLHAPSAAGAVERLLELEADPCALEHALGGVISQRLVSAVPPGGELPRRVVLFEIVNLASAPFDGNELTGAWWRRYLSRNRYRTFGSYRREAAARGYRFA